MEREELKVLMEVIPFFLQSLLQGVEEAVLLILIPHQLLLTEMTEDQEVAQGLEVTLMVLVVLATLLP